MSDIQNISTEKMSFIETIKHDLKNTSYRIYVMFLVCITLSVFLTACVSGVGPSKRFVNTSYENSQELFPVAISLIENANADILKKAVRKEDQQAIEQATKNGLEIYKMGLIRKFKNWRFDIKKQHEILQSHDKKIKKE
ncbi:hypothetical protein [Candidatus Uabimicrobium amorphum]|uniref:Uncharacterized protein n=1 Tax=Uabimicrobium amorphum TaxID=2596890 RepID=A0A5S9IMX6_UABAM|nr:hypothetical protein [Candidatus Uabimicrobium amorphum]BBM84471.1 hypothetical protein UABAM_02832 [Candidatus Uabimicrobium amorphum]